MTMMRRLLAVALLAAAAGCGGTKTDTTTTTSSGSTRTVATVAPAAATVVPAPAGTMSVTTSGGAMNPSAAGPPGFPTETAAQTHCASDQVVWLNTKSKVYHAKGTAYYGHTKQGAYVCQKEADAAGDHAAKNGT